MRFCHPRWSWPAATILAVLLVGCQAGPHSAEEPVGNPGATSPSATITPAPTPAADDPIDRILAISVDGLNPAAIHQLGPSRTPNFHRLMREGATTLNARTAHEQTRTLPNHTGMLTGRRSTTARAATESPSIPTPGPPCTARPTTTSPPCSTWSTTTADRPRCSPRRRSSRCTSAPGTPTAPRIGSARITGGPRSTDSRSTPTTLASSASSGPNCAGHPVSSPSSSLVPDQAGHDHGFMSKRYLTAVRETDRLLGQILNTIDAAPRCAATLSSC